METGTEHTQELRALRDELAAQEALRGNEREQKKLAEEERWEVEETLRKSQANNDQLKEEREKLLQDKDKLRRQEELCQQKDRDDRLRSQINRCLKQKIDDFDKLYWEHKQTEANYKRRGTEFDRKQDKLKELLKEARTELAKNTEELAKKTEALAEEHTKAVATAKLLEEATKEKLELNK